ncbi:hypothetical protein ACOMHN_003580 [Nucella lapillus]
MALGGSSPSLAMKGCSHGIRRKQPVTGYEGLQPWHWEKAARQSCSHDIGRKQPVTGYEGLQPWHWEKAARHWL